MSEVNLFSYHFGNRYVVGYSLGREVDDDADASLHEVIQPCVYNKRSKTFKKIGGLMKVYVRHLISISETGETFEYEDEELLTP